MVRTLIEEYAGSKPSHSQIETESVVGRVAGLKRA